MRATRIHHPAPLADDAEFELDPAAARHLMRVLRLRPGDAFVAFDGSGREWPATLIDDRRARTGAGTERDTESPLALTLVQGVSRGERMDYTLQKAVELGVAHVMPVTTRRTEVRLDAARARKRHEHWLGVVVAACEQSGRTRVPTVAPIADLGDALAALTVPVLVLDPAATRGLREAAAGLTSLALVVGPEGGLADDEIAQVTAVGGTAVKLGPRVLRTETAGVAATAALQALFGDLAS